MIRLGLFSILVIFSLQVIYIYSQQELQQFLEKFYEETGKFKTIDELELYLKVPLELKKENSKRLSELIGVSKKIANQIINMSNKNFDFEKICDSLNLLTSQCEFLKLFTKPLSDDRNEAKNSKEIVINLKSRLYSNFERDSNYLGDNIDSYQSLLLRYGNIYSGLSISKDIGEPNYLDNKKFYLSFRNANHQIVLGKFIYKNFWGNVLGEPFGIYKGSNPCKISYSNNTKLRPTTSSIDYGVFNGIAILSNFEIDTNIAFLISGFVSSTKRSGNFDSTKGVVTSVYTMDYFRNLNELNKKGIINENSYFFQTSVSLFNTSVGYSLFYLTYDKPFATITKKFIQGNNNLYHSIFFEQKFSNFLSVSAEISFDKSKTLGIVGGTKFTKKGFSTTVNIRYFSTDFRSPFGSMLGENSYPNDEFGLLFSTEIYRKGLNLQFYADYFKSLAPTYLLQVPFFGNEQFFQLLFSYHKNMFVRAKVKREEKTDYVYNVQKTHQIPFQRVAYSLLLQNNLQLFGLFESTQRFDFLIIDNKKFASNQSGVHFAFDLETLFLKNLKYGMRCNYFSTVSYNSAIYFFEIIAPEYMYSIPFFGTGFRFTCWTSLKLFNFLNVYLKYYFENKGRGKNFLLCQFDLFYPF